MTLTGWARAAAAGEGAGAAGEGLAAAGEGLAGEGEPPTSTGTDDLPATNSGDGTDTADWLTGYSSCPDCQARALRVQVYGTPLVSPVMVTEVALASTASCSARGAWKGGG